ncbi:hypothetical protein [Pedobacter jejuensis]|uniref:Uncharacterized protein n=1 Tax=Pedobacter jejuensis TaxID=1268550 RepID=A0A3N0BWZ2_9SPHI|nr:hypothetical protein [Pedobacter jejuensis]RNL53980.1 hypothetical protein D7004_07720 [Pedobacter jejuensis]
MKTIKYYFLLVALLFQIVNVQAQGKNIMTQNQNIKQFIQIWGLVKYKSQKSIVGKFDADKVFLSLIESVKNADQKQLNQLVSTMIGPVDPAFTAKAHSYDHDTLSSYQHLLKNVDYNWIKDKKYTIAVRKQLTALSNQVNLSGNHQYIPAVWYESDLPNEAAYTDYTFNEERMNLLTLAKVWNAIEYLFPYKYI